MEKITGDNKMNNEFYFFWYIKSEEEILFEKMITSKKFDDIVQKPRIFVTEIMFYLKLLVTQFGTDV
jgi:hypothetical protein